MKELVKHLWRENKDHIVSKSLKNCHTVGLDSIMLLESPEQTIRLFITTANHGLWRNNFPNSDLSIAFHTHHCNITLHCIYGQVINYRGYPVAEGGIEINKYFFDSVIKGGDGKFKPTGTTNFKVQNPEIILPGQSLSLNAAQCHTILLEQGKVHAWFVFEGKEDPHYIPLVYSNHDPNEDMLEGLYYPLTESAIEFHLRFLNLL